MYFSVIINLQFGTKCHKLFCILMLFLNNLLSLLEVPSSELL